MDIQKTQQYNTQSLIQDLRQIIEQARGQVAATANYTQTMMYWHIGERINRDVLGNQRAEYGKQIVSAVSTQLQEEYGKKGFEPRSIWRMMQFAQVFPDSKIVSQLATKLFWSHFELVTIHPIYSLNFRGRWTENYNSRQKRWTEPPRCHSGYDY